MLLFLGVGEPLNPITGTDLAEFALRPRVADFPNMAGMSVSTTNLPRGSL